MEISHALLENYKFEDHWFLFESKCLMFRCIILEAAICDPNILSATATPTSYHNINVNININAPKRRQSPKSRLIMHMESAI